MSVTERSLTDWFEVEYLDTEEPVLVLAINTPFAIDRWESGIHYARLSEWDAHKFHGREFRRISHQTAGYACHHHHLTASVLTPTPMMAGLMDALHSEWEDSCAGQWGVSLDAILRYRGQLQRCGLDCNVSYRHFEEGIYPIDITPEAIALVTSDSLPRDLEELIDWTGKSALQRACGCIGRWRLYVLTENCD